MKYPLEPHILNHLLRNGNTFIPCRPPYWEGKSLTPPPLHIQLNLYLVCSGTRVEPPPRPSALLCWFAVGAPAETADAIQNHPRAISVHLCWRNPMTQPKPVQETPPVVELYLPSAHLHTDSTATSLSALSWRGEQDYPLCLEYRWTLRAEETWHSAAGCLAGGLSPLSKLGMFYCQESSGWTIRSTSESRRTQFSPTSALAHNGAIVLFYMAQAEDRLFRFPVSDDAAQLSQGWLTEI